jgi:hypothetical protein
MRLGHLIWTGKKDKTSVTNTFFCLENFPQNVNAATVDKILQSVRLSTMEIEIIKWDAESFDLVFRQNGRTDFEGFVSPEEIGQILGGS